MIPRSWPLHSSIWTFPVSWRPYREISAHHLKVNLVTHEEVTHRSNSVCRVWGSGLLSTWPDSSYSSSILGRGTWKEVQRGLITYQPGKNPNQITMTIFLPADNWKETFQLVLGSGFWFWFVFTWICCPQRFSTTCKNFQPFHFMANITTGQGKCNISWIHCLYSIPVTTWCNFILKTMQGHISCRIFLLPRELF